VFSSVFFPKEACIYDRPNLELVLLDIEPVWFIDVNLCGRFWAKIKEFGQTRPENSSVKSSVSLASSQSAPLAPWTQGPMALI
jgi:hypothetical protein